MTSAFNAEQAERTQMILALSGMKKQLNSVMAFLLVVIGILLAIIAFVR
jgi:hypothetical protein